VSVEILNDGRPFVIVTDRDRIGRGAWARLFATSVVPDEGSSTAALGRALAGGGNVHTVGVGEGTLSALVDGGRGDEYDVTITAAPVSPRIWSAIARFARGNRVLEAGVEGREQSVHLEHLMAEDWGEPLVPRAQVVGRTCTCGARACEHLAAFAYVIADQIDEDPSLLLRWRGCVAVVPVEEDPEVEEPAETVEVAEVAAPPAPARDPWLGGQVPEIHRPRPFPVGAVMKRLGSSGLRVGGGELADVLQRAYASFAASTRR
jgi:uncharacterized Zn finger protein